MKQDTKFNGPRTEIMPDGKGIVVNETIFTHIKSGNEFILKEIQTAGFIVWLVKTLGQKTTSTQNVYLSRGQLNEYSF